jgi:hypothetical protein
MKRHLDIVAAAVGVDCAAAHFERRFADDCALVAGGKAVSTKSVVWIYRFL